MPHFRSYSREQPFLIPQDLQDWIPDDHLVRFVADVVATLHINEISGACAPGKVGRPTYDPRMMLSLLIYAYIVGVPSSRKIESAIQDRLDFRWLAGGEHPDHDCIAAFRKKNIGAFSRLFTQVLLLCRQMGMVKLGRVAIDGTKIRASASRAKTHCAKDLLKMKAELEKIASALITDAERIDTEEDALYGVGKRGDELPDDLANVQSRLARIDEALATLREAARAAAAEVTEEQKLADQKRREEEEASGKKRPGKKPQQKDAGQLEAELFESEKLRINLTDPDSQLMRDGATGAIVQGYNAQIAVDCESQIIVAAQITQDANDKKQLVPVLLQVQENLGQLPGVATADSGYFSAAAVTDARVGSVDLLVPPDRACTTDATDPSGVEALDAPVIVEAGGSRFVMYTEEPTEIDRMRAKLKTPDARDAYKSRGTTAEPVFGQVKSVRNFRGFLLRGEPNVGGEWNLVCLGHNLLKMYRASRRPKEAAAPQPRRRTCACRSVQMTLGTL